jgi:hypothetical protein
LDIVLTRLNVTDEEALKEIFHAEGCPHPQRWEGGAGEAYDWHAHGYHKILFCLRGSIAFQDRAGLNYRLRPGDRQDIEPGTDHMATAGPEGVSCMESYQ